MTTRLHQILLLAVAGLAALALAACGSEDEPGTSGGGGDVDALLKQTFANNTKVRSAKIALTAGFDVKGVKGLTGPITFKANGPFQSVDDGRRPPQFDLDLAIEGGPQALELGATFTGDKGFVNFQGQEYELSDEVFRQFEQGYLEAQKKGAGKPQSLATLGVDPRKWLTDPKIEGDADVGGQATTKITAGVDAQAFVEDLNSAMERLGSLGLSGSGKVPETLTDEQKRQVVEAVKSARVEIYTGKDDKLLRRLFVDAEIVAPEGVDDFESADVDFDVTLTELNEEQQIEAPSGAKPFEELAKQLGSLGLGGLGGLGGSPGSGSGSGGGASSESLEKYSDCIKAAGSDVDKARECADLLKTP